MRASILVKLMALLVASLCAGAAVGRAATLAVDDDGKATPLNCDAGDAAFGTVQAAVNAAVSGDTVYVCPGIYDEQVELTTSHLTIRGAGAGLTVLRPAAAVGNATNAFGNPVAAIILVDGATHVNIVSLTVDGSVADSGASILPFCPALPFYAGIYFQSGSGTVDTAHVTGIQSGSACAFAIAAESAGIVVKRSLVDDYGTTGIVCTFPGTICTLTDNAIRGRGPVDDEIQAGILVRAGAAGRISGNVITDHFFVGAHGVPRSAVGIFLVLATPLSNPHIVRDNIFADNQVNVQRRSSAAAF
jgi:hypothetical protein